MLKLDVTTLLEEKEFLLKENEQQKVQEREQMREKIQEAKMQIINTGGRDR